MMFVAVCVYLEGDRDHRSYCELSHECISAILKILLHQDPINKSEEGCKVPIL
jgi:hypothetical protein